MFVYIEQTNLRDYSRDLAADILPEGIALKQMRQAALARTGVDLFGDTIKPGDRVVIKPNFVRDRHPDGLDLYALITHPAVIRAVVDEVYQALGGEGQIIIADAPIGDADFDHLLAVTGLQQIVEYYRRVKQFPIEIRDLRKYRYTLRQGPHGYAHEVRSELLGDPGGYVEVDLGSASAFASLEHLDLLQGTDVARRAETIGYHTRQSNKYLIARTILDADVVISMPKLKTHGKVGVTLNAKNMVGINGDKNYLPHFRWGSTAEGGDQHPAGEMRAADERRMRVGRLLADHLLARNTRWSNLAVTTIQQMTGLASRLLRLPTIDPINGHWPGNDTCWRLPADLIRLALFADRSGAMQATPQRRFLSIVDGIVGGEGNGPLRAAPKACGVLLAGLHPIAVDLVAARLMGFAPYAIKQLYELSQGIAPRLVPGLGPCPVAAIEVLSNHQPWCRLLHEPAERGLDFQAPPRWAAQITAARPVICAND
ncbi:MAG TPA: DUF362 domain-containing protein [Herpetosiphonaceae bacterium]